MSNVPVTDFMDEEGENLAVRTFLKFYGSPGLTVGGMARNMQMCGYPYWPEWVGKEPAAAHLTKAGAQLWLRHLFGMEHAPGVSVVDGRTACIDWGEVDDELMRITSGTKYADGTEIDSRSGVIGELRTLLRKVSGQ